MPGKPIYQGSNFSAGTIKISWAAPDSDGGWPITAYHIYVDDGSGNWFLPVTLALSPKNLVYEAISLIGGTTYGFKIEAINDIGTSVESNTQYFVCADLPDAPSIPTLDQASVSSITVAWNAPIINGGSAMTGFRLYINAVDQGDWFMVYDGIS